MFRSALARRILFLSIIGIVIGILLAEIPFMVMPQMTTRPPQEVLLIIPAGTAQRVAQGQQPPSIPQNMTFVVGDTLVVKNEDSVQHQLGPLFIPAGTSASMKLDTEQKYSFQCSFVPTKVFGLDVGDPLTWSTRLWGIIITSVPLAIIIVLFSLLIWPPKKEILSS
jgi:hypothetical protein